MEATGASLLILLSLVEGKLVLAERSCQLTIEGWMADGLVCLGSPRLAASMYDTRHRSVAPFFKNLRVFIMGVYEYLQIGLFILDPWDRLFIIKFFYNRFLTIIYLDYKKSESFLQII
jgi:hypothetical protein